MLRSIRSAFSRIRPNSWVRTGFFVFFMYSCVQLWRFYQWALGNGPHVVRPEAVAGVIPLGAYMSFFAWLKSGVFDPVMPAGLVIIIGAIVTSLLFKRGFCGWICPVGTGWHFIAWLGSKLRKLVPFLPRWFGRAVPNKYVDYIFRGLRYVLAFVIFSFVARMSVEEALQFQQLPYYATADLKIMLLTVHPETWYILFWATIGVLALTFGNVWCRYLCPLGGLYGPVGSASPCTIHRDPDLCIDCKRCARVCHAMVRVDKLKAVRSPECDGCMDCVIDCPVEGALTARFLGRVVIPWWVWPMLVVGTWLAVYLVARATGHWSSGLPEELLAQFARITTSAPSVPAQ